MNKNLEIVITMAGLGTRFKNAGYKCPKYMIEVNDKTLFEWSIISLEGYNDVVAQYIFIVLDCAEYNIKGFIDEKCKLLGIINYRIIVIKSLTDGQASTALLAAEYWNRDNELLIYNIDTYIEANQMKYSQLKGEGFIPCFKGKGDHWSFCKLDKGGKVIEVKEKERISEYCTVGAYYFKSCKLFEKIYNEYYANIDNSFSEKYVAPMYNYLISKGGEVYISVIDTEKVHVLGTPEELNEFKNRLN